MFIIRKAKKPLSVFLVLSLLLAILSSSISLASAQTNYVSIPSSILLSHGDSFVWAKDETRDQGVREYFMQDGLISENISRLTNLELDFYIDNLANLKSENGFESMNIRLYTGSSKTDKSTYFQYNISDQIIKNGNNHISLKLTDAISSNSDRIPDLGRIVSVFYFVESDSVKASQDYSLSLKNIYATRGISQHQTQSTLLTNGEARVWQAATNDPDLGAFNIPLINKQGQATTQNLSGYSCLEFDYFIEDLYAIKSNTQFSSFNFRLYSGTNNYTFNITNQIIKSGLNHIVVSLSDIPTTSNFGITGVSAVHIFIESNTVTVTKNQNIYLNNVYATKDSQNLLPLPTPITTGQDLYTWNAGKTANYGNKEYRNIAPATWDLTGADYIEFDFYVDDFTALKACSNYMSLHFRLFGNWKPNNGVNWDDNITYTISNQVVKNGYSHIKLSIDSGAPTPNFDKSKISRIFFFMENNGSMTASKDFVLGVQNICLTKGPESSQPNGTLLTKGALRIWDKGHNRDWISQDNNFVAKDISTATHLEFDYYVDDIKALKTTANFKGIYMRLLSVDTTGFMQLDITELVVKDGLNHVRIPLMLGGVFGDFNIRKVNRSFVFLESYLLIAQQTYTIGVKNLYAVVLEEEPAPPPVEPNIDQGIFLHNGTTFFWNMGENVNANWANQNYSLDAGGVDISEATDFEFDYYISDWEALKTNKDFKNLCVRLYTNADFTEFITLTLTVDDLTKIIVDNWTHIKISLSEIEVSKIYKMMFFMEANQQMVPTQDFKIAYKNIFATRTVVIDLTPIAPQNATMPLKPDGNAIYLSDCESLVSNGTWIPSSVQMDTSAKTEGYASIFNIFSGKQPLRANMLRLILFDNKDISSCSDLRFDLYISDVDLLKQKSKVIVRLSSDTKGSAHYIQWVLTDVGSLVDGWNQVSFNLKEYEKKDGSPDLSSIKVFSLICEESSLTEEDMVRINIDNLRVYGATESNNSESPNTGSKAGLLIPIMASGAFICLIVSSRKKKSLI